jgi:hypothetical protein
MIVSSQVLVHFNQIKVTQLVARIFHFPRLVGPPGAGKVGFESPVRSPVKQKSLVNHFRHGCLTPRRRVVEEPLIGQWKGDSSIKSLVAAGGLVLGFVVPVSH